MVCWFLMKSKSSLDWCGIQEAKKIIGLAMSPDDMSSLHNTYQLVDETSASKHILQFLRRDLTSSFDLVGPCNSQLESKFIVSCVLKSLWAFHLYGFCLVCDGASANISALKSTCDISGAYGVESTSTDQHKVELYFHLILTIKSFGWLCVCVCVCVCVLCSVCWVSCVYMLILNIPNTIVVVMTPIIRQSV